MQFLQSFVGSSSKAFPYTLKEDGGEVYDLGGGWQLYEGEPVAGAVAAKPVGAPGTVSLDKVSVFKFDKKTNAQLLPIGENFLKRTKTLRHPNILLFVDALESEKQILIATEYVRPLSKWLQEPEQTGHKSALSWGFHCLLNALGFINMDCKLIHGNLSINSVFVTPGGDWKLGGFQIIDGVDPVEKGPGALFRQNPRLLPVKYQPPERLANKWSFIVEPVWGSDVWALGCLVYEALNGAVNSPDEFLNEAEVVSFLRKTYRQMLSSGPSDRPDPKALYKSMGFKRMFKSNFVKSMLVLEEIQLKSKGERQFYFKELMGQLDSFPEDACKYKILPAMVSLLKHPVAQAQAGPGGGSGAPDAGHYSMLLGPILRIGSKLKKEEEYIQLVVPAIVTMFACNDRGIRVTLLQKLGDFVKYLDAGVINNHVFPSICGGFGDTTPILRELTLKSMLPLAPKLNTANVNDKLMRHLCNLQDDPEPSIRTNTVICMSRIASYTNVNTRKKLLVGAFTKATRQAFPHTRVAGIKAIISTYSDLMDKPQDLVSKVLPTLCLLFNDPKSEVRTLAFTAARKIMDDLEERSKEMEKQEKEKEQAAAAPANKTGAPTGGPDKVEATSTGASGGSGASSSYLSQAAGWAMSGLSKQWTSTPNEGAISPEKAPVQPPQAKRVAPEPKVQLPREPPAARTVVAQNGWNDDDEVVDSEEEIFHDTMEKPKGLSLQSKREKVEDSPGSTSKREGSREERKLRLQKRREEARMKRNSKQKLSATKLAKEALKDDDFFNSF